MKQLYDLHGQGVPIREIAERMGISRNTVRKYFRSAGIPKQAQQPKRCLKRDANPACFGNYSTDRQ